jgi:hypothetical protein
MKHISSKEDFSTQNFIYVNVRRYKSDSCDFREIMENLGEGVVYGGLAFIKMIEYSPLHQICFKIAYTERTSRKNEFNDNFV